MPSILSELFNDPKSTQQLNELTQPYSRTSSAINKAKSSVKGLVGGGQYEQGAEQSGQLANRYFMQFKRYVGTKYGKKPSYVTYDDVAQFMKSNNLDASLLGNNTNSTYTPKDVSEIFLKAAQQQASQLGNTQPQQNQPQQQQTQPAQVQQQQNAPQQQAQQPTQSAPQQAPAQSTQQSGTLASLTPEQRKQLLTILSKMA